MDPTQQSSLYYWLAFVHPALMTACMMLVGLSLRLGLQMRTARQRRTKRPLNGRMRHLRLAKLALWIGLAGFVVGPVSMVLLRSKRAFDSLHAFTGLAALALAVVVALLGQRLERGKGSGYGVHGGLGLIAAMAGLVAVVTGIELLP